MRILICTLLLTSITFHSFSQQDAQEDWLKVLSYGIGIDAKEKEITPEEASNRSLHCLPQQFSSASISLSNGTDAENVLVKFDYKEQVLLVQHGESITVGAPNIVDRIDFYDEKLLSLLNVNQPGKAYGRKGFYLVLAEQGQNYLLIYKTLKEKAPTGNSIPESATLYHGQEQEPEYIKVEEMLITKNQKMYVLNNFKVKAIAQLTDQSEQLQTFIKENKLKYKNEDDLKKFALYYWSL